MKFLINTFAAIMITSQFCPVYATNYYEEDGVDYHERDRSLEPNFWPSTHKAFSIEKKAINGKDEINEEEINSFAKELSSISPVMAMQLIKYGTNIPVINDKEIEQLSKILDHIEKKYSKNIRVLAARSFNFVSENFAF